MSIVGQEMMVETTEGREGLKIGHCSQIYELGEGQSHMLYKYHVNGEKEKVLELALLFDP